MNVHRQGALLLLLFCWGLAAASYRVRRQGFALSQRDACTPPGGGPGRCVSVNRCEQIFNIFAAGPIPSHLLDFLRRSICRRDAVGRPMFCCSLLNTTIVTPPSTLPPTQPPTQPPSQPPTDPPTEPATVPLTQPPTVSSSQPPSEVSAQPLDSTSADPRTTVVVPAAEPNGTMRVMTAAIGSGADTSSVVLDGIIPLMANCGNSDVGHSRIVGGRLANKGDWPWLAALGYVNSRGVISYSCGAALITRRHVLTAAHCVEGQPSLRTVRLGEHDLSITTEAVHEDYNITKRTVHEGYNSNFRNDIALLELDRDVVFKKHISPICLPRPEFFPNTNLNLTKPFVAGWGSIAFNNRSSSTLRDVFVPFVNNDECRENYKRFGTVTVDERILCAGFKEGGKDACQGDSGGPLMYPYQPTLQTKSKYFVIGVVSLGYRCAEPGYPGIYSKVTYYLPWVLDKLNSAT